LHSIPIERAPSAAEVGKGAFVLPDLRTTLENWTRYHQSPSITMTAALRWVEANEKHIVDRKSIVHGELQFHNVLSHDEEITAVIDWELVHIGHPAADLGYCKPAVETMTTWDKFMDAYLRAGGVPVTREEVDYFAIDYVVRLLPTAQHVRNEFEQGRQNDVMFATVGPAFLPKMLHRLSQVLASALGK
jgi:aminoglycoside phosphotransferase (APT) family kinase protein